MLKNFKYIVEDLDCANCAKKLEDEINKLEEVHNAVVNFAACKITLESELDNPLPLLQEVAARVEPDCSIKEEVTETKKNTKQRNFEVPRLIIGIILAILGFSKIFNSTISTVFVIAAYLVLLYRTAKKAVKQIKGKIIDENTLIVISCIGAYLVGKETEGLMVILLFEIGKILEGRAISKSRKSIKELMDIKPEYANLKKGNEVDVVKPEEVKIGDIIVVKQGEKIPLDGIIVKGTASLNTAALTGESKLSEVNENDEVLSGSINVDGLIEIKVIKEYKNSTVNRILELVEKATDKKAKTENFVSKSAKIYTPIVIILATLVAIFMPMIVKSVTYSQSIYKALIFLVIACPCSIAISVPLSYFSGIGKSSKEGVLVKGSDYLDALKDVNKIVFDKTGTITTGNFEVVKIKSLDEKINEEELLEYFAIGESFSNHPIANSIVEKYGKTVDNSKATNVKEITGKGIEYSLDSKTIKIGNSKLIDNNKSEIKEIGTIIYIEINNELKGYIVLGDRVKDEIKATMEKLDKLGIETFMFTGDGTDVAEDIAKQVGIKNVKSQMLPEDKFKNLEEIIEKNDKNKKVAFVGDGINDSPVLARADVGISMGGIGASSAIEASDIVIMTDKIDKIIRGIEISKKTNKIIKQNLTFAIGVKLLIFVLSILGVADMWQAVFADVGTTIITIFNTLRILR